MHCILFNAYVSDVFRKLNSLKVEKALSNNLNYNLKTMKRCEKKECFENFYQNCLYY
jgi:hypothetical protein